MSDTQTPVSPWQFWLTWFALIAAYFSSAQLGLWLASLPGNISPFWPPSGIALAALLIGGLRLWSGVFIGSVLVETFSSTSYSWVSLLVIPGISLGNTLEAVLAAALIRELNPRPHRNHDDLTSVFVFSVAALITPLFSALLGTASLFLGGYVQDDDLYAIIWQTFWKSAVVGILIFTPLVLSWYQFICQFQLSLLRILEVGGFAASLLLLTLLTFAWNYPLEYLYLPLLMWLSFRFQPPFTFLCLAALSVVATIATTQGQGPFVQAANNAALLQVQSFIGALAFTLLLLIASIEERRQAYQKLQESHTQLTQAVEGRTVELCRANTEILSLNLQLQKENARMSTELAVAWALQQLVLPKSEHLETIEQLEIAGMMQPATEVGGDYYDVLPLPGRVLLSVGDVAGHGLASGVVMLMVQTCVRTLAACNIIEPRLFFQALNQVIYENLKRMEADKHLTLVLLIYEKEGIMRISGQHEEILLVKNAQVQRLDTINLGFIVGLRPTIGEFVKHLEFTLQPGDGVVVYTDGITEALNHQEEAYSVERLCALIEANWHKTSAEICSTVSDDVYGHLCGKALEDDLTLLIAKRKP